MVPALIWHHTSGHKFDLHVKAYKRLTFRHNPKNHQHNYWKLFMHDKQYLQYNNAPLNKWLTCKKHKCDRQFKFSYKWRISKNHKQRKKTHCKEISVFNPSIFFTLHIFPLARDTYTSSLISIGYKHKNWGPSSHSCS